MSLLQGLVAVRAVEGLHVIGLPITRLGLLRARIVSLSFRRRDRRDQSCRGDGRTTADGAKELPATDPALLFLSHPQSSNLTILSPIGIARTLSNRKSGIQCEGLGLNLKEASPERADSAIEIRV